MRLTIKNLLLLTIILSVNACKCKSDVKQNGAVYVYTFEKGNQVTTADSKKMITQYMGIANPHELTVSADENIAYFVADEDLNITFEQDLNNGNFEFSKITKAYLDNDALKLPSEEESVRIAKDFLKTNGIAVKNDAEIRLVHSGGIRSQSIVNGKQAGPIIDKVRTLTYGRMIDSLPVIGAGSKIVIQIGDKGQVLGITRRWRELQVAAKKEIKPEEMISIKEAQELAKRQIASEFGANVSFETTSTQKSYYDGNGNILQPVWAFNTLVNLKGQNRSVQQVKYLCIIPMLKNSTEPIKLTAVDPRAKEMIRETKPYRDSARVNVKDTVNKD
jgi:hypothetical protein